MPCSTLDSLRIITYVEGERPEVKIYTLRMDI